ncbi:MAG: roadblock/LC7 domain-containing protein [Candidatus Obscuribacterales bacterium]|nr:roadblock/LC7 domain-containing protein [Candidatus Obscuribacterales bacterium]
MQELPPTKPNFISTLKNLISKIGKKDSSASQSKGGGFPHISRQSVSSEAEASARNMTATQEEEMLATSVRLKSLSKIQPSSESEQVNLQALSLSQKFGVEIPARSSQDGPLTLAESIRRQVQEQVQPPSGVVEQAPADFVQESDPASQPMIGQWGANSSVVDSGSWQVQSQPQTSPVQDDGWGAPPVQPQASPIQDGWGAPPVQPQTSPVQDDGWGAPPAQPQTSPIQNDGWGAPPAQPQTSPIQNDGWGAPPAQPQTSPIQNDGWGVPPAQPQTSPIQNDGWGAPPAQPQTSPIQNDGWGAPPAQPQASPIQDDGWGAPPAQPQAASAEDASWSEESEQIQTGMWKAFSLEDSGLGSTASKAIPPTPKPAPAPSVEPVAEHYEMSIQEKLSLQRKQQGQMFAAPEPPAPVSSFTSIEPPTVPIPGSESTMMDRLTNILGDSITEMAQEMPTPGDVAELQVPVPEPMVPPPPTAPVVPEAPPVSEQPTADFSSYEMSIQERKQLAANISTPAPAPVPIDELPAPLPPAAPELPVSSDLKQPDIQPVSLNRRQATPVPRPANPSVAMPPPPQGASNIRPVGRGDLAQPLAKPEVSPPPVETAPIAAPPPVTAAPSAPSVPPAPPVVQETKREMPVPPAKPPLPGRPGRPPVPPPSPVPQSTADSGGLKKLDDKDMDRIFRKLGVKESELSAAQANVAEQQAAPLAAPAETSQPPAPMEIKATPAPPPPPPLPPVSQPAPVPSPPPIPAKQALPPPVPPVINAVTPTPSPIPMKTPLPPPVPPAPKASATSGQQGLFKNIDDAAVDKIFDNLGVKESKQPVPKVNVREAVQSIRSAAVETGVVATPAPKIAGIDRLDAKIETTHDSGTGKISSIGKFLLDQQDQQQIGKLSQANLNESKVRVLTLEAADEIYKLLNHVASLPGVVGSSIVGHDGIPIANNLPQEYDPESIGALALGVYFSTTNSIRKMGHNHVHQLVAKSPSGYLIIADFGGGILITVSSGQHTEQLIPLMRSITQLVAQ